MESAARGKKLATASDVDRHRFDANHLDPNFHVDADLDPGPDCHQIIPILMLILPQVLQMLENLKKN
jgi:hypothetical protein